MVFKKFSCVIKVMVLISHVHCVAAGYERDELCKKCQREPPMQKRFVVEEDIFHLKHADPCHGVSKNDPRMKQNDNLANHLCNGLSKLYFQSELFRGGQTASACQDYTPHGCVQFGFDMRFNCMVHIESTYTDSSRLLWECVEEDLKRYRERTRVRGAQYTVNANPEIQRKYGDLNVTLGAPRAAGQPRSPRRNSGVRGRSASPLRVDQGRSSSFRRRLLSSLTLRRSRNTPSQSAMNPAVMSSARPQRPGKIKYH
ncbi:unnamed protein product [Bemisia tabaci]|uniref:Uncharacterized protein n=1 Tax=Bemisia tabaci TaxID=7038 RepID=A0A9P0G483_BEMTA|nr:unnamed protein product [Bemisia tabaci]